MASSPTASKPAPLDPTCIAANPAPLLVARRGSGTKIGSRATPTAADGAVTSTSTPGMPQFSPIDKSPLKSLKPKDNAPAAAAGTKKATDVPVPVALGGSTTTGAVNTTGGETLVTPTKFTVTSSAADTPRNSSTNAANAPAADTASNNGGAATPSRIVPTLTLKVSKSLQPSKAPSEAGSCTPRATGRSRSGSVRSVASGASSAYRSRSVGAGGAGASASAGKSQSRYAVMRPSLRPIAGKSYTETDIHNLNPPTPREANATPQNKRHTAQSHKGTQIIFSNEESKAAESLARQSRVYPPNSTTEAPWEHDQFRPASPKRAGSAKPSHCRVAPWDRDQAPGLERSVRSHSACITFNSTRREAPFGTTAGADAAHFHRGEDKIVQYPRPCGARPTSGIDCSVARARDNDVMNADPDAEAIRAPSGRRPPPASHYDETPEFNRPSSVKLVPQPERVDRPRGLRGHPMATAATAGSPFRSQRDDDRLASLSPEQSMVGPQSPTSPTKRGGRVLIEGRSFGAQSMTLNPYNEQSITSNFSPQKAARKPNQNRGRANIESAPDADLFSQMKVDPVRANRFQDSLVGVLNPAPVQKVPAYTVVPPFWTNELQ